MLVCLQEVKFHNSFIIVIIICILENIPKETNVDAGKILGGEKRKIILRILTNSILIGRADCQLATGLTTCNLYFW